MLNIGDQYSTTIFLLSSTPALQIFFTFASKRRDRGVRVEEHLCMYRCQKCADMVLLSARRSANVSPYTNRMIIFNKSAMQFLLYIQSYFSKLIESVACDNAALHVTNLDGSSQGINALENSEVYPKYGHNHLIPIFISQSTRVNCMSMFN